MHVKRIIFHRKEIAMPIVNSESLKALRKKAGITNAEVFAERARLSEATIKRAESKGELNVTARTAQKLATALNVTIDDLAKPANAPSDLPPEFRSIRLVLQEETILGMKVVEALYGISPRDQLSAAPLFAALLAEESLVWRRSKLQSARANRADLDRNRPDDSQFDVGLSEIDEALDREDASIASRDVLGRAANDSVFATKLGSDPRNPLARYLASLVRNQAEHPVQFLNDGSSEDVIPMFSIGASLVGEITGDDLEARLALVHGGVSLRDIPAELKSADQRELRIAWLRKRLPTDARKRMEAWRSSLVDMLGDVEEASK